MTTEHETPSPQSAPRAPSRRSGRQGISLAIAVIALALAGWQWFETRQKLNDLQQEVSRKLSDFDTGNKEERGAHKQVREQLEALQGKLGSVEGR
jgi:uroporphyrin-3 C-methyltransferase